MAGIPASASDAAVLSWIKAARQRIDGADGVLGRALINQGWDLVLDGFPCTWARRPAGESRPGYRLDIRAPRYHDAEIAIPLVPLVSVDAVRYLDAAGGEQTLDPSAYRVIKGEPGYIVPARGTTWPGTDAYPGSVTISFTAGYGAAGTDVPEAIRAAIALHAKALGSFADGDPNVRSEMVYGIDTVTYDTSGGGQMSLVAKAEEMLAPFRVGGGIS
jgi:hypothetical protein